VPSRPPGNRVPSFVDVHVPKPESPKSARDVGAPFLLLARGRRDLRQRDLRMQNHMVARRQSGAGGRQRPVRRRGVDWGA